MKLASIFQDHAVLQRDLPIPVWGTGTPGEVVAVTLAHHTAYTTVSESGCWILRLPPLPAGGPHKLSACADSGSVALSDILVGEVWICSGQSNMEMSLESCGSAYTSESAANPNIRLLTVRTLTGGTPAYSFADRWALCTPESLAPFSAAGSYFGRELHRHLNVPIGLIANAWGGTRIQAWMSREALYNDRAGRNEIQFHESFRYAEKPAPGGPAISLAQRERDAAPKDPGNAGVERGWTSHFDDSAWPTMPVPSHWQEHGHNYSGIFWFRRTLKVPAEWAGKELTLHLGAIDKHDDTYVNGAHVGSMGWDVLDSWRTPRVYKVPGRVIKADGLVTIAVRARSHLYHGGLSGPADVMRIFPTDSPAQFLPLAGNWRFHIEHNWGLILPSALAWTNENPNSPHMMYDVRLTPVIPYGMRGVIWYQGESNAGEAALYRRLLPAMIADWRRAWGQGDFPFVQVQLASYQDPAEAPGRSEWAELRDAQSAALSDPAVGLAVAIDIGEAKDIHPKNKRDVGLRLARWALARTYGRNVLPSGPLFTHAAIEGDKIRCHFQFVGDGLSSAGGPLQQFAVAGDDRRFRWATATVEGQSVVVFHPDVARPAAVRYAWSNNPHGANLQNSERLPAVPFRSDDWPA